jgi:GTPase SAR1 family protein
LQSLGADDNPSQCLQDLLLTDPRLDKERIEASKDRLLEGSCSWVLEDEAFLDWWQNDVLNLLWIRGDAGKGKTMMTIALISEISKRLQSCPELGMLSYFFCQSTSSDLNSAVAVLRGLIYQLVIQEKALLHILQERHKEAGKRLFEGPNALYALFAILEQLVQKSSHPRIYLIVDALDECDFELGQLLKKIFDNRISSNSKVKWLVTSRNETHIKEAIITKSHLCTSLELNSDHVGRAVLAFIEFKVSDLAGGKKYSPELRSYMRNSMVEKAEGTFLWVALVCKELEKVPKVWVKSFLSKIPAGLGHLYDRMLEKLQASDLENFGLCQRILCTIVLGFRPLHLRELQTLIDTTEIEAEDLDTFKSLVEACGSFVTIRDDVVYLVHQSVKDYFTSGTGSSIFSSNLSTSHQLLARRCIRLMTGSLRKNMCGLAHPGVLVNEVTKDTIEQGLGQVQYTCLYWLRHLGTHIKSQGNSIDLNDGGCVDIFLQTNFLYWLETLGMLRKISEGVLNLLELLPILSVSYSQ